MAGRAAAGLLRRLSGKLYGNHVPVTTSLRLRAATLVLAAAAAGSAGVVVSAPAHAAPASDPCAAAYRVYSADKAKAADYYALYKRSSGAARNKAYDSYAQYLAKSKRDLQDYDTCLHNH